VDMGARGQADRRAFEGDSSVMSTTVELPIPPLELIFLVAGGRDVPWFLESGRRAVSSMEEALSRNGKSLKNFDGVLDFGCGCGRAARHLVGSGVTRFYGSDLNPALIDWCRAHLPFGTFLTNRLDPPIDLAAGSVDFAYALSVFTHLDEARQYAWMSEMRRVLRHGGLLLITTHGRRYVTQLESELQKDFESGTLAIRFEEKVGANECGAFHPPLYVWGDLAPATGFEVIDFVEEGAAGNPYQDLFLLRRLADESSSAVESMVAFGRQLRARLASRSRVVTEGRSASAADLQRYVDAIHSSIGWKVTQALRGLFGRRW
jgi:SAM-dependent methyltransferase